MFDRKICTDLMLYKICANIYHIDIIQQFPISETGTLPASKLAGPEGTVKT
jgi:hypothetical protein